MKAPTLHISHSPRLQDDCDLDAAIAAKLAYYGSIQVGQGGSP